jgi:glucokinase
MAGDLALAIDLGGTQLRAAMVASSGDVLNRATVATDVAGGPMAVLNQMQELARDVGFSKSGNAVQAMGVCAPGPLDSESGTILNIPTLPGWTDFPLRRTLRDLFSLPVTLENDGISAAFGEWKFGAGKGLSNLVYVTVSTGIGGGIVSDSRLLRGSRGMAGHVGHMMISRSGPTCACGGVGCFEALASGTAFARAAAAKGFSSGEAVLEAFDNGMSDAALLVNEEVDQLSYGFASLIHLYSPQRLIMGGGMSRALLGMLPQIRLKVMKLVMPPFHAVEIVGAALGDNSGLVGAAGLALQSIKPQETDSP